MSLSKKLQRFTNPDNEENDISGRYGTQIPKNTYSQETTIKHTQIKSEDPFNLGSLAITRKDLSKSSKSNKKSVSGPSSILEESLFSFGDNDSQAIADTLTSKIHAIAQDLDLDMSEEFDAFLDDDFLNADSENSELRNNLVSMGRKYARDNASSKEMSAISKTFSESEKRLKALYEELDRDKANIQKDLDRLRIPQRGNSKLLSDLASAKNSLQSTQLQIVKEINSLRKSIFDLQSKEENRKSLESAESSDINSNTLQSIFAATKSDMVRTVGGYEGVSGSGGTVENALTMDDDDELIQQRYFAQDTGYSDESEGDLFLKYEGRGVEYVLLIDEERNVQDVLAEDNEGNVVPDYPMPSNLGELTFDISRKGNHATDNLHRNYKVRTV